MFCGKCGQELENDARFCHNCGATIGAEAAPAVNEPGVSAVAVPAQQKKKGLKVLIPVIAGVALVAVVVMLLTGVFASDSARLMKAMTKSGQAYAAAAEKLELPDLGYMEEEQAYSAEMSLWLEDMEYYEELHGLGIRAVVDMSVPQRQMGMTIAPYFGAADLLNVQMKLDDDKIYLSGGDLTGGKFYMVNTETLGADLNNMGMNESDLENFGFNIFEMAQQMQQVSQGSETFALEIAEACKTFAESVEVEKTGTETVAVNGNDLSCTAYDMLIPQEAMNTLLDSVKNSYIKLNDETNQGYMEVLGSMGLPDYVMEEMEASMEYSGTDYEEMFASLTEALDTLGDIELDMYVSGGYVVAVVYEKEIDGSQIKVVLNLGGGENYVDDLSLSVNTDGYETRITSTGNHSGADGKFTDETVVEEVYDDGDSYILLVTELSYEPKAEADNFKFTMDMEEGYMEIAMLGQVTSAKDSIHIRLNEIAFAEYDEEFVTLGMEYKIGKYSGSTIDTGNAVALGELTESELMDEMSAIEEYATEWLYDLMENHPELMYMFY